MWPPYRHYFQGRTNGCGPATLAIALSRFRRISLMPEQVSRLMSPYRVPLVLATPPWSMQMLAKRLGYYADVRWRGSLDYVRKALAAGSSVIVMVRPVDFAGESTWGLHYRSIAGMESDRFGAGWVWLSCSALNNNNELRDSARTQPANLRLSTAEFEHQWLVGGLLRWMLELSPG